MTKGFFSNLDPKSWVIVFISVLSIVLLFLYFTEPSGYKKLLKQSESRAEELQKKRQILKEQVKYYKEQAKLDSIQGARYQQQIDSVNKVITLKDIQINFLKSDLQTQRNKLKETQMKIKELENNPIKRKGDELIESLKEKTK